MGILWKEFELPKRLVLDEATATATYGKFIAEPFERGYGITLGNALRRVLLSSIEGTAVTSMRVESVSHEFSSIPGVTEDVTEIVLNIKQLILRSHTRQPKIITLHREKKGAVTARDITTDDTVEIINPDLHLLTLTESKPLTIELEVGRGRGYVPAERNKKPERGIGLIAVDALFSPVKRVNFAVEDTRVGQVTDYDRLLLDVWTNGSLMPQEALLYASHILQRHFDIFTQFGQLPEDLEDTAPQDEAMYEKLRMPVSELELSVRSANCLREARIQLIGDLVQKTEQEMLKYRNFGKKSLQEITEFLQGMGGLKLGMTVDPERLRQKSGTLA